MACSKKWHWNWVHSLQSSNIDTLSVGISINQSPYLIQNSLVLNLVFISAPRAHPEEHTAFGCYGSLGSSWL